METKDTRLKIMSIFFEEPENDFYIREIARKIGLSHTGVRKRLIGLEKEGLVIRKKSNTYEIYTSKINKAYLNLKLFYNLEKIRDSGIIGDLEKEFEYPTIVLFGSYSKAIDDNNSDVDLFIISTKESNFKVEKYDKILKRKIQLHIFTRKKFQELKKKSPELVNSVCNGIVLSGNLEVL